MNIVQNSPVYLLSFLPTPPWRGCFFSSFMNKEIVFFRVLNVVDQFV